MDPRKTIVVVMPAYNEATVVGEVLSGIPSEIGPMPVTVVVVDDGSTDGTGDIARRHGARVVRHMVNIGPGAATRTGFRMAQELDADVIVTLDADGQHDPKYVEPLVNEVVREGFDVVLGSRLRDPAGMPPHRFIANLLMNLFTFVLYRRVVSDSQSGFKAMSREALERMELRADGYEICSEIIGEIASKGLRYKSVPVRAIYTAYSRSKGQHFLNGVTVVLELLGRMLRRV